MNPAEMIALAIGGILAVAGAISTLGSAANWIVKLIQAIKAPNAQQNKEIAELQEWRKGVDQKLDNDNRRLNKKEDSDRITQRSILALLSHGIDGNHIDQMVKARDALQEHLINQ